MTYSIDQLKGEISRGGGVAKANLFRVILPIIPEIYLNLTGADIPYSQSMNVLCKNAILPGRQLLTADRVIGTISQKVAYGFANEEVTLTFTGLNNYVVRKYFEDWQHYAMNPNSFEVKYKTEYAKTVTIQQLNNLQQVMYSVELEKAFPTQIMNVEFANDNINPVDISVTLAYTIWRRNNVVKDVISTEVQDFLEDLFLKG
jgi:hypothetical protein